MANNKLVTIHQATSQRGGPGWNAWDGTFPPLRNVILTNNVNEMASYLSPICTLVSGVKASLKVHPLCASERIRARRTKRLWFSCKYVKRSLAEKSKFSKAVTFLHERCFFFFSFTPSFFKWVWWENDFSSAGNTSNNLYLDESCNK